MRQKVFQWFAPRSSEASSWARSSFADLRGFRWSRRIDGAVTEGDRHKAEFHPNGNEKHEQRQTGNDPKED
jgi:hypothetical protein